MSNPNPCNSCPTDDQLRCDSCPYYTESQTDIYTITLDFIKACYNLLDKYKVMDEQAIGERIALLDGHFYLEIRANGNLVLCDNRIMSSNRRIKSNTYKSTSMPMGIAMMLSRYIDLLTKEGYFDKD